MAFCDVREPLEPGRAPAELRAGWLEAKCERLRRSFDAVSRTRSTVYAIASRKGRPISLASRLLPAPPAHPAAAAQVEARASRLAGAWRPGSSWRCFRS